MATSRFPGCPKASSAKLVVHAVHPRNGSALSSAVEESHPARKKGACHCRSTPSRALRRKAYSSRTISHLGRWGAASWHRGESWSCVLFFPLIWQTAVLTSNASSYLGRQLRNHRFGVLVVCPCTKICITPLSRRVSSWIVELWTCLPNQQIGDPVSGRFARPFPTTMSPNSSFQFPQDFQGGELRLV